MSSPFSHSLPWRLVQESLGKELCPTETPVLPQCMPSTATAVVPTPQILLRAPSMHKAHGQLGNSQFLGMNAGRREAGGGGGAAGLAAAGREGTAPCGAVGAAEGSPCRSLGELAQPLPTLAAQSAGGALHK